MSHESLSLARERFQELAALEDSGTRGGVTWARHVVAMQGYGDALLHDGGLLPTRSERLELALAGAAAALEPPRRYPALDLAIARLRAAVEEASASSASVSSR